MARKESYKRAEQILHTHKELRTAYLHSYCLPPRRSCSRYLYAPIIPDVQLYPIPNSSDAYRVVNVIKSHPKAPLPNSDHDLSIPYTGPGVLSVSRWRYRRRVPFEGSASSRPAHGRIIPTTRRRRCGHRRCSAIPSLPAARGRWRGRCDHLLLVSSSNIASSEASQDREKD